MKRGIGKRVISLLMAVVLVFAGILAFPSNAEAATKKLTLSASKMTVYVGKTESLTVKKVQGLSNKKVTYKSSNKKVATVTAKGKVKGVSVGSAVITVTSKANSKVTATCKVTVKQPVKTIQTASKLTLQKGKKVNIAYSIAPQTAANKKVTFQSMNVKVATVTAKGVVKGIKAGTTKIKITSKDGQAAATIKVTVKKSIKAVTKVSLNKTSVSLTKGNKETLTATVKPKKATSTSVYWVSANPDVAKVTAKGVVTAVAEGTTKVTAYAADSSGKKASCTVTVTPLQVNPEPQAAVPVLTVDSELYGSVYTNGKSTLKAHLNTVVDYDSSKKAVLKLTMPDGSAIDNSKIDSSNAKVALVEGDGYYPSEYIFKATELKGSWSNGTIEYTLSKGDLEVDRESYPQTDYDSGREWSCLGGDGHGNYLYNLEVSGITYDGKPVASQTFPLRVYVYGYNYTADAVSLYGENGTPAIEAEFKTLGKAAGTEPEWTWVGEGEMPILCDTKADDFYVTWPASTDASGIQGSDVTVTLTGEQGDTKKLEAGKDFKVNSAKGETQIALTYQNWAFIPVYTKMTVAVNGTSAKAEKTFDIASVYVYETQQGGGGTTVDGTVTAYNFYGLANLTDVKQLLSSDKSTYTLSYNDNGTTKYVAEENGKEVLTEDKSKAKSFEVVDGDGLDGGVNPKLVGNAVYTTTRQNRTIKKTIDGEEITFTCNFDRVGLLNPSQCDQNLKAAPGYVIPWGTSNWITNEKWAWQKGIEEGWIGINIQPYTGKFEYNVEKGKTQQFTTPDGDYTGTLKWEIVGNADSGTSVTQNGLLTVAADESHASFAVTVTDANGKKGTVTINVKAPSVPSASEIMAQYEITSADIEFYANIFKQINEGNDPGLTDSSYYERELKLARLGADLGNGELALWVGELLQGCHVEGLTKEESVALAIDWWERASELGQPRGWTNIGLLYQHSNIPGGGANFDGIEEDADKALEYLLKGYDAGDSKAPRYLAMLYEATGEYVNALKYYEEAAALGDTTGQSKAGQYYVKGLGTEQNFAKAMEYLLPVAESVKVVPGVADAQYYVGYMYENGGTDVAADKEKAIEWYTKAASNGSKDARDALERLGVAVESAMASKEAGSIAAVDGNGVAVVAAEGDAVQTTKKYTVAELAAASAAISPAELMAKYGITSADIEFVANIFKQINEGNNPGLTETAYYEIELKLAKLGADLGNGELALWVGEIHQGCHVEGLTREESVAAAIDWWERASELGQPRGWTNIGLLYQHSNIPGGGANFDGIEEDADKALEYLLKGYDAGDSKAPRYLALLYESEGDYQNALIYFEEAAGMGDTTAQAKAGQYYLMGLGTGEDYAKAFELLLPVANNAKVVPGVADAQYYVGYMYENGKGAVADRDTAVEWYTKAAANGSADAAAALERLQG